MERKKTKENESHRNLKNVLLLGYLWHRVPLRFVHYYTDTYCCCAFIQSVAPILNKNG